MKESFSSADMTVWLSHKTTCVHNLYLIASNQNPCFSLGCNSWIWHWKQSDRKTDGSEQSLFQPLTWVIRSISMTRHSNLRLSISLIKLRTLSICCLTPVRGQAPHPHSPDWTSSLQYTQETHTFFFVCGWNDYWCLGLNVQDRGKVAANVWPKRATREAVAACLLYHIS